MTSKRRLSILEFERNLKRNVLKKCDILFCCGTSYCISNIRAPKPSSQLKNWRTEPPYVHTLPRQRGAGLGQVTLVRLSPEPPASPHGPLNPRLALERERAACSPTLPRRRAAMSQPSLRQRMAARKAQAIGGAAAPAAVPSPLLTRTPATAPAAMPVARAPRAPPPQWRAELDVAEDALAPSARRAALLDALRASPHATHAWAAYLEEAAAGAPDAARMPLLRLYIRATRVLPITSANRHDPVYLRLWLALAHMQADNGADKEAFTEARETFKIMKLQRIGLDNPALYLAWAALEERAANFSKASRLRADAAACRPLLGNDENAAPVGLSSAAKVDASSLASGSSVKKAPQTPRHDALPQSRPPVHSGLRNASPFPFENRPPRRAAFGEQVDPENHARLAVLGTGNEIEANMRSEPVASPSPRMSPSHAHHSAAVGGLGWAPGLRRSLENRDDYQNAAVLSARPAHPLHPIHEACPSDQSATSGSGGGDGFSLPGRQDASPQPQLPSRHSKPELYNADDEHIHRSGNGHGLSTRMHGVTSSAPKERRNALDADLLYSPAVVADDHIRRSNPGGPRDQQGSRSYSEQHHGHGRGRPQSASQTTLEHQQRQLDQQQQQQHQLEQHQQRYQHQLHQQQEQRQAAASTPRSSAPQFPLPRPENTIVVHGKAYQILQEVGKGGSSRVYMVLSADMRIFALKRVKVSKSQHAALISYANEIKLLQSLQGRATIVQLHDAEVRAPDGLIYLIMEYGDIDLAKLLVRRGTGKAISDNFRRLYWQQMLEAVNTIHEHKIVHGDLKPANFVHVAGTLKLIDFGIAKAIQTDDTTKIVRDSQIGTPNYMSPEALMAEDDTDDDESMGSGGGGGGGRNGGLAGRVPRARRYRVGRASDIWSLGCILYQMAFGRTPFAHIKNTLQKLNCIQDPTYEIHFPSTVAGSENLLDVLRGCLQRDPTKRMGMPELMAHPYVAEEGASRRRLTAPAVHDTTAAVLEVLHELGHAAPNRAAVEQVVRRVADRRGGGRSSGPRDHTGGTLRTPTSSAITRGDGQASTPLLHPTNGKMA